MPSIINATTTNGVAVSGDNSGALALQTNNGTTAVTISTGQNVGIGTTSPAVKCHVSSSAGVAVRIDNPSGTSTGLQSYLNGNLTSAVDFSTSGTIFYQNAGSGACPERMRITSNGQLYVGTTSNPYSSDVSGIFASNGTGSVSLQPNTPSYQSRILNLSNAVYFDNSSNIGYTCSNGNASFFAPIAASAFNVNSDYRLKENITPLTNALDKVNKFKPVKFSYKADNKMSMPWGTEIVDGFLAHEFAEVVPTAVTGEKDAVDENGEIVSQTLDMTKAIPLLVAAIQELKAELDATKAEVQALKGVA